MSKQKLLQEISNILDKNESTDDPQFYAHHDLLVNDFKVVLDEVGELSFPLSERCIKKLVNIFSEDDYEPDDETSSSNDTRNTPKVTSDKFNVSFKWEAFDRMLNKIRIAFGFHDNCILIPKLDNVVICGAGETFRCENSKGEDNVIGFLIIVLPNSHLGGTMFIKLGRIATCFLSEAVFPVKAKCFAFYAECSYEMSAVKAGYLLALVYKLIVKTKDLGVPSLVNQQLNEAIRKYFDLKEDEQKFIYMLRHNYSKYNLKWNILKGKDHKNSLLLYSAAKQLGLIPHLALVEIAECITSKKSPSMNYKKITLTFWVDSENKNAPYSKYYASENDVCFVKDLEAYSGHKYNRYPDETRVKYYKLAAVVLWPVTVTFSKDFSSGYNYFLGGLIGLCQTSGNQRKVINIIAESRKCLCESYFVSTENKQKNILNLVSIALYVENSETAFSLLSNSELEALSNEFAEKLANLQLMYGVPWCVNLLNKIKTNSHNHDLVNNFLLIRSFLENKVDTTAVKLLLGLQYELITNEITQNEKKSSEILESCLPERIDRLHDFFKTCLICKDYITLSKIIQKIESNSQQYPLTNLTELYVKIHESDERVHFKQLRTYLTKTIDHKINALVLNEEDWSINFQLICNCENCALATSFLQSKTEKTKIWPLREKLRNHIIEHFRSSSLPVKVMVKRTGSPYKLVLVKRGALHKRKISKEFDELKLYQKKLRALED